MGSTPAAVSVFVLLTGTVISKQSILELEQDSDVPDYGKYETVTSFLPVAPAYDSPWVSVSR